MAYDEIDSGEIVAGKPVASTLTTKIKGNFDDHEERITDLENGNNVAYEPLIMRVDGYYESYSGITSILKTVCNFNLTITGARLYIEKAGSSGTTEIDIKVSSGGGGYSTIFTTKPSVAFGAGDDGVSSNAILDPTKVDLTGGDLIRLDVTSAQVNGRAFMVRIDYEKR